jgi:uncharacterized protein (TIGR02452 family)
LEAAQKNTLLLRPSDLALQHKDCLVLLSQKTRQETTISVTNETTLQAAQRLVSQYGRVFCLNFASAKNAGGGFLGGSQAQEESLARSSGLYVCIESQHEYYSTNRACGTCLYTNYMIYSPKVPVLRTDDGNLLDAPYLCSFLTAPAVNAGAVLANEKDNARQIEPVMRQRIEKVLEVALAKGYEVLLLGAWGCGVFQNNPKDIAQYFKDILVENPQWKGIFKHIVFAVYDSSKDKNVLLSFEQCLAGGA